MSRTDSTTNILIDEQLAPNTRTHTHTEFYMTDACGKAFQNMYDGKGLVGEMVAKHWDAVSKFLSGHPGVLAYEVLNEPWFGDWIKDPSIILESGKAEQKTVGPFMERMHGVIRANDETTPVMYAPAELNNRFMRYSPRFIHNVTLQCHHKPQHHVLTTNN